MHVLLAPLALIVERLLGYPGRLTATIGHPVMWFGKLIALLDTRLNRPDRTDRQRRESGIVALLVLLLVGLVGSILVMEITSAIPQGWIVNALVASAFLAQKELGRAVGAVADGLDVSLEAGRQAVSHVVGRDPEALDSAGVSRAAIETLAENTSDGVVAPLFWLLLLGLPGIVLYKAINTADSMIGHLNDRYRDFGWASARLDDVVNYIPARLTALLFCVAAVPVHGASPSGAFQAIRADAHKHASPNAGWPEAAMAGALGFALGGPRAYHGEVVDLPQMGSGRADLDAADIRRGLDLYRALLNITLFLVLLQALLRV